ncbi:MAG: DMT family transporter [Rikenellaceae bacterium]
MKYNWDLIIANILFGVNYSIFVSLLGGWLTYRQLFLLQLLFGALIFTPYTIAKWGGRKLNLSEVAQLLSLAVLTTFGWLLLILWGGSLTSPMDMASVATLGPSFTLVVSYLLGRERVNAWRVLGIAISLAGGVLLISHRLSPNEGEGAALGNIITMGATLAMAINTVAIKSQLARLGAARLLGVIFGVGLALALPLMGGELLTIKLREVGAMQLAELGYLLILGTALPLYLLYIGVKRLSSIYSALYRYLQPLIAAAVIALRGGKIFDEINLAAGWVMILGFLFLLSTRRTDSQIVIK